MSKNDINKEAENQGRRNDDAGAVHGAGGDRGR